MDNKNGRTLSVSEREIVEIMFDSYKQGWQAALDALTKSEPKDIDLAKTWDEVQKSFAERTH